VALRVKLCGGLAGEFDGGVAAASLSDFLKLDNIRTHLHSTSDAQI
jgi:hypothetical protein